MKRRKLSLEETKLWEKVAKSTLPLNDKTLTESDISSGQISPKNSKLTNAPPKRTVRPQLNENIAIKKGFVSTGAQKVKMDMKAFAKLKKGMLEPEAWLDLHGMTLEQAYPALLNFIVSAHNRQKRLVLVITGKGKNSDPGYVIPQRNGVLRSQVPLWLKEPRLSTLILQVEKAHQRHGGYGALYIYLRRSRS